MPGTVRLKNGGWVEGDVLEVQPGQSVSVRAPDGTIRQIPWAEVERVDEQAAPATIPAPPPEQAATPAPAPAPSPDPAPRTVPLSLDDPNVVDVAFTLEDRKVYLIGMPRSDASSVAIRFERFVREAQLAGCEELTLTIDGTQTRLPIQHKVANDRFATREIVQVKVTLETIKQMIAAKDVSFDTCGTTRKLTLMHGAPMKRFVAEFERNVGKPVIAHAPPPAQAGDYDAPPRARRDLPHDSEPAGGGYREHTGLMLRLTTGLGYAIMSETVSYDYAGVELDDVSLTVSGAAIPFSLDVGGAVSPNFNLHGRISFLTMPSPSLTVQGEDVPVAKDASATAFLFGGGFTYYFMPANFYLTGVLGAGMLRVASAESKARTSDLGVAVNFDVGKEWWVGGNWGLGLAGRFHYSHTSLTAGTTEAEQSTVMIGVLMSATLQ